MNQQRKRTKSLHLRGKLRERAEKASEKVRRRVELLYLVDMDLFPGNEERYREYLLNGLSAVVLTGDYATTRAAYLRKQFLGWSNKEVVELFNVLDPDSEYCYIDSEISNELFIKGSKRLEDYKKLWLDEEKQKTRRKILRRDEEGEIMPTRSELDYLEVGEFGSFLTDEEKTKYLITLSDIEAIQNEILRLSGFTEVSSSADGVRTIRGAGREDFLHQEMNRGNKKKYEMVKEIVTRLTKGE